MWVDGRSASSGTVVVAPGQKAEIQLPFGKFRLAFNPTAPAAITINGAASELVFNGVDNPLGVATTLDIPVNDGTTKHLALALYAIGDGKSATHVLHYTVS